MSRLPLPPGVSCSEEPLQEPKIRRPEGGAPRSNLHQQAFRCTYFLLYVGIFQGFPSPVRVTNPSSRACQYGAGARHAARQGVQAGEARAERSVEDVQAQHVPAYFRAA